jgi:iron complex transport system permease protein
MAVEMAAARRPGMHRAAGDRSGRAQAVIAALALALAATALVCLTAGASDASAGAVLRQLVFGQTGETPLRDAIVIYDIRLPRILLCMLVGASLAVSGAVMQGLFRNPLADPGLLGVSAGSALGAILVIVLGSSLLAPLTFVFGDFALPVAAFFGALLFTAVLQVVATRRGRTSIATMLLAGIALSALAMALIGLLVFMADDRQIRDINFWQLGSLAGANWTRVMTAGPIVMFGLLAAPFLARGLNALSLGEATASHLGIPLQRFKMTAIVVVAATVGASVAVSGGIGFVGIVVPHVLRLSIGPDNRYLLPASALLGAILLLAADAVSRTIVAPAELPIGILTAIAGAPVFLWILLRNRNVVDL